MLAHVETDQPCAPLRLDLDVDAGRAPLQSRPSLPSIPSPLGPGSGPGSTRAPPSRPPTPAPLSRWSA